MPKLAKIAGPLQPPWINWAAGLLGAAGLFVLLRGRRG